jgi:hypothetical protein
MTKNYLEVDSSHILTFRDLKNKNTFQRKVLYRFNALYIMITLFSISRTFCCGGEGVVFREDFFKFPQGHINTLRIICIMWKNNGVNRYKESLQSVQGFKEPYSYIPSIRGKNRHVFWYIAEVDSLWITIGNGRKL